jgi:uncharacterized protein (DUF983 family)
MAKKHSIGQLLRRALLLKCPDCGHGSLYRRLYYLNHHCEYCGLIFEREQGYFVGAIYVNYSATVGIAIPGFFILDAWRDWTIEHQLWLWLPFAIIFPLLFFHHSRSLWLALDHFLNPPQSLYRVPRKS